MIRTRFLRKRLCPAHYNSLIFFVEKALYKIELGNDVGTGHVAPSATAKSLLAALACSSASRFCRSIAVCEFRILEHLVSLPLSVRTKRPRKFLPDEPASDGTNERRGRLAARRSRWPSGEPDICSKRPNGFTGAPLACPWACPPAKAKRLGAVSDCPSAASFIAACVGALSGWHIVCFAVQ